MVAAGAGGLLVVAPLMAMDGAVTTASTPVGETVHSPRIRQVKCRNTT
jgi:hypothetical protein